MIQIDSLDNFVCTRCGAPILQKEDNWRCDCSGAKVTVIDGVTNVEAPDFWADREEFKEELLIGYRTFNRRYRDRFYVRGWTPLGLLNTVIGSLFNRVLVKHMNDQGKIIKWSIARGTDFPREK